MTHHALLAPPGSPALWATLALACYAALLLSPTHRANLFQKLRGERGSRLPAILFLLVMVAMVALIVSEAM